MDNTLKSKRSRLTPIPIGELHAFAKGVKARGAFCFLYGKELHEEYNCRCVYFPTRDLVIDASMVRWSKSHYIVELWGQNG